MDQDHLVGVKYLVEDSKVTHPKPKELVAWTTNRLYELARGARICAKTIDRSLQALALRL